MKHIPLEHEEQENLVYWLRLKKLFFFSPMSENNTHKQNRKYAMIAEQKAKKMGKSKGTSDIFVFLPNKLLIIELKRRKKQLKNGSFSNSHSKPSKEQLEFLDDVSVFEYVECTVAYGWHEAKEFIESHL